MAKKEYGTRKKYHFIYKTTNLLSGRYYIGMHSTDNLEDGYLGSGIYLKRSINKHGKENHSIEILEFLNSREELAAREREIISLQEIAKKECMNLKVGGEGGFTLEQTKNGGKLSGAKHASRMKDNPDYKEKVVTNLSTHMKESYDSGKRLRGEFYNWKDKKHSKESLQKMKEVKKNHGVGSDNSQFGKCWITNEVESVKISKGDLIPEGWRLGRRMN